jgi:hypothetical protein
MIDTRTAPYAALTLRLRAMGSPLPDLQIANVTVDEGFFFRGSTPSLRLR